MDQDFSGSCTATSRNPLIQRGATTATKSEPFRPQRGAPGSIVKDLPLRREAACYRELPRISLPRTTVNRARTRAGAATSLGPDTPTAKALSAVTAAAARGFFSHAGYRPTAHLL